MKVAIGSAIAVQCVVLREKLIVMIDAASSALGPCSGKLAL